MPVMNIRTFVSSSFDPGDKDVVTTIVNLLHDLGLECCQANCVPKIPDDAIKMIGDCDLFVTILTPRKADLPSPSVSFEVGCAFALDKKVIVLRQTDVPVQTIIAGTQQIPFHRKKVVAGDRAEMANLAKQVTELCRRYGLDLTPDPAVETRYEFAKRQAQLLGSMVLGYYHDVLYRNEVRDRAIRNFPTEADRRANQMIKNAILDTGALTFGDKIISEEEEGNPELIGRLIAEEEFVWIIDPLDGTLNFAYGFPFFCVSLGLLRRGEPVIGAIYSPTTQELFAGRVGRRPECIDLKSGTKRYLQLKNSKTELGDCIVMTHLSGTDERARRSTIGLLNETMRTCRSIRILGSGQMALIAIALEQFDIFLNVKTHIWDIVPGYVILKGAGGWASGSIHGCDAWNWHHRGMVAAANKAIGERFCKFLGNRLKGDFPTYPDRKSSPPRR